MNIGIVGSRRWKNREDIEGLVNTLAADTTVVSGGARGVDTWATQSARKRGLKVVEFLRYKFCNSAFSTTCWPINSNDHGFKLLSSDTYWQR